MLSSDTWHWSLTELPICTGLCPPYLLAHPLAKRFTDRIKTKVCASKMWRFDWLIVCVCVFTLWSLQIINVLTMFQTWRGETDKLEKVGKMVRGDGMLFPSVSASSLVSRVSRCLKDIGKVYIQHRYSKNIWTLRIWYDVLLHYFREFLIMQAGFYIRISSS